MTTPPAAAIIALALIFFVPPAGCVESSARGFVAKNMAGGRMGVWTGTVKGNAVDKLGEPMEFSKSSLYAEFFYNYRIAPAVMAEFSTGIFSRGDFKYLTEEELTLGTVNLYSFLLSGKLYPLVAWKSNPFHLYLQGGGGLIYGSQTVTDNYYGTAFTAESELKFSYFLGAGIDWPVADQIAILVNYKYLPVEFGSTLAGIKDYTGWQISFGVGYTFGSK